MNILFDHQAFCIQQSGGISRYIAELNYHFNKSNHSEIAIKYSNNINLLDVKKFFPNIKSVQRIKILNLINTKNTLKKINENRFDIFHPTYYNPYFLDKIKNKPFVVTVHDMIHEKYPHYFVKRDKTALHKKILIEKSTHIIAISENTKNDIISLYPKAESKISVIYHGSSFDNSIKAKPINFIDEKYFLYVGARNGYKNFNIVLEAFASFSTKYHNIKLVCIGGGDFNKDEIKIISNYGLYGKVIQTKANDPELTFWYSNCISYIYPSQYEGFGIPILEAYSCNCPVILSNSSCFPEIAVDTALYFDKENAESLAIQMEKIFTDTELRNLLISKGEQRSKLFSWEITASKTLDLYKSLL